MLEESDLIYDWNGARTSTKTLPVEFNDETLRDGLQSPSVIDPAIETKLRILHLIASLGIQGANHGLLVAPSPTQGTKSSSRSSPARA